MIKWRTEPGLDSGSRAGFQLIVVGYGVILITVFPASLAHLRSDGVHEVLHLLLAATMLVISWMGYYSNRQRYPVWRGQFFTLPLVQYLLSFAILFLYWWLGITAPSAQRIYLFHERHTGRPCYDSYFHRLLPDYPDSGPNRPHQGGRTCGRARHFLHCQSFPLPVHAAHLARDLVHACVSPRPGLGVGWIDQVGADARGDGREPTSLARRAWSGQLGPRWRGGGAGRSWPAAVKAWLGSGR
jgi:hypothetical protein